MHHEVRAASEADDRFRFQAIYACVPECVKLIDANERLIDMNPAGLRMIDAPSLNLVRNRNILDLIAPSHRQAFSEAHAAVFQGRAVRLQFEVVGFSGRKLWMDQSAAPLFDRDNSRRVVEMVAVTRDITVQRESEAELLQARIAEEMARSRAEFIAGVGHELNVPQRSNWLRRTPAGDGTRTRALRRCARPSARHRCRASDSGDDAPHGRRLVLRAKTRDPRRRV